MRITPTTNPRFNEPIGFLFLAAAAAALFSLGSYHPLDPSPDVATGAQTAVNLVGLPGAWFAAAALQWFGLAAFLAPIYLAAAGWVWLRGADVPSGGARLLGAALLTFVCCATLASADGLQPWSGAAPPGGAFGAVAAGALIGIFNQVGAAILLGSLGVISLYLLTSFQLVHVKRAAVIFRRLPKLSAPPPWTWFGRLRSKPTESRGTVAEPARREKSALALDEPAESVDRELDAAGEPPPIVPYSGDDEDLDRDGGEEEAYGGPSSPSAGAADRAPWEDGESADLDESGEDDEPAEIVYRLPMTSLLAPPQERTAYDKDELHAVARQIVAKFDEFKVGGTVVQINPGPVVTTFEFRPDPGVKYSKIINLSEDLCLALECESILVERIPGKSTVGIEVPNRKRDIIVLREVIESRAFRESEGPLTVALGKDINGQIRVADLASMPHLLVAGSTGSGKSVMINAFIMSILLRATPDEVRFIMVDPKTVELGLYHEIPHLLTPVITDMKKASNALKNATSEMERRLKLLAEHAVRNIDQFNRKIDRRRAALEKEGAEDLARALKRLPYIVIIIDELADLMILEGRQIEESVTRLAQMARAVGIHLILATQRPSVDVVTGLIKANIPARMSFRLATRVDSRTILDTMGAEALLGKGDMLFLPPGTQRLTRLHGPFITEDEIESVVKDWKGQAKPRYETEYLAPPADEADEDHDAPGFDDPVYQDAVRVVVEMGKASTSTLQRRLRIGYGRAASILDAMEKDGVIGPPDGSRPREVLKRPDWLAEVEHR